MVYFLHVSPFYGWIQTGAVAIVDGVKKLPGNIGPGIGGITKMASDAFKTNPVGTIAGVLSIGSLVGVPVYKWLTARAGKLSAEAAQEEALREKASAELETRQTVNQAKIKLDETVTGYEGQIESLKNTVPSQSLESLQQKLEQQTKSFDTERISLQGKIDQLNSTLKELKVPSKEGVA